MKTFTIIDWNKPGKVFTDCVGCILEPKKFDQLVVYTASGQHVNVGPQMMHALSMLLYQKVIDTALVGGTLTIPDLDGMNDDDLRIAIDNIKIEA